MGNFIQPDWDMFQSTHPCAAFHAASRAISGGPIYISDTVGNHNFDLLKKLALPDGTILRCEHYALPTKDCLFADPLHDGKTMLKIWNLNKVSLPSSLSYTLSMISILKYKQIFCFQIH
jgi:raffinose synthase